MALIKRGIKCSKKSRTPSFEKKNQKKKNHKKNIAKKIKNHKNNYEKNHVTKSKNQKISYTIFEVLHPSNLSLQCKKFKSGNIVIFLAHLALIENPACNPCI